MSIGIFVNWLLLLNTNLDPVTLLLGDEHDYSRRPTNRNHLQHHILPIPRRPLHFRSLHGRSLRKRHRHGKHLSLSLYLSLSTHLIPPKPILPRDPSPNST